MVTNSDLERLARLVRLAEFMSKEQLEKLLEIIRAMKAQDAASALPKSAVKAMTDVVDDKLMRDIVQDLRSGPGAPGWIKPSQGQAPVRGTGWAKPTNVERSKAQDEMFDAMVAALAGGPNSVRR